MYLCSYPTVQRYKYNIRDFHLASFHGISKKNDLGQCKTGPMFQPLGINVNRGQRVEAGAAAVVDVVVVTAAADALVTLSGSMLLDARPSTGSFFFCSGLHRPPWLGPFSSVVLQNAHAISKRVRVRGLCLVGCC